MGMYTELIFGASLKKDTPIEVIESIKYLIGEIKQKPKLFPLDEYEECEWMLTSNGCYFGVNGAVSKFWQDNDSKLWILSARFNIKNYACDIESFLEWIKPYIQSGSGNRGMYAIRIYEEDDEPTIYYLY